MNRPYGSFIGAIKAPMQILIATATLCIVVLAIPAHAAAGRTAGSFSVDSYGGANYAVSIWAPRGPNGLQPGISLTYSSNQSNGYVGTGWAVSGISSITRCNGTFAQDGAASGISLTMGDALCLDGQRLRLTSGSPDADGSTYQTEIANFVIVTAHGTKGEGPAYFLVQAPNGSVYEYGNPVSSAYSQVLADGTSTALTWMIDKVTDAAGNTMVFSYSAPLAGSATSPTLKGSTVPTSISWTPTSFGSTSYQYTMVFNYSATPNALQSSLLYDVAGTAVENTELLSSIAVTATLSGTTSTVKQYNLNYSASPSTQRELLATLTECADQTLSNCLLPSSFAYQTTNPGVSTGSTTVVPVATFGPIAIYDFNGDGIKDLLFQNGTTWYVAFGSSSGFGSPVSTGIVTPQLSMSNGGSGNSITAAGLLVGDVLGNHHDGILVENVGGGSTLRYYSWNGSSFVSLDTGFYGTNCGGSAMGPLVALANIRGNGLPDVVTSCVTDYYTRVFYTNQNTSANGVPSFSPTAVTAFTDHATLQLTSGGGTAAAGTFTGGELRRWDFDGDGREDVFYARTSYGCVFACGTGHDVYGSDDTVFELLGQSDGTFTGVATYLPDIGPYAGAGLQFGNWNDDKCTDVTLGTIVYISACNGTPASQLTLVGPLLAAIDVDGDGRTDAVIVNPATGNIGVQFSQGSAVSPTVTDLGIPAVSAAYYGRFDIGGAGLDNLSCFGCTANTLTYYSRSTPGVSPDLLVQAKDGFGNFVQPNYEKLFQTANYTASGAAPPEVGDAIDTTPLVVVSSVIFSDPKATGATYTQSHYYTDGWENLQGRGFLGFTTHEMVDSRNAIAETWTYNMVFPNTGLVTADVTVQNNGSGHTISSMAATPATELAETLSSMPGEQRYYPYITTQSIDQYEVGGSKDGQWITDTSTTYGAPDAYGNVLSVSTTVTDKDSDPLTSGQSWTTATSATYAAPVSPYWCVNLPTQTQVTQSSSIAGTVTVTQLTQFTPDVPSTCREATITHVAQTDSSYNVTESLQYDQFGNINSDQIAGAGILRTTITNWGATGQFPASVTDPSGAQTQYSYNLSYGKISSSTDPNNQITSWQYNDGFGRKTRETRPDGTYTTDTYQDCASLGGGCLIGTDGLYVQSQDYGVNGALQSARSVYYDSVGRPLVKTAPMLSGGYARNEVRYDSFGNVLQQAAPCVWSSLTSACTFWTVNSYDILNRPLSSQHPENAVDSTPEVTYFNYAGRTTSVTDPNGHTKTQVTDPNGWLRETQDGSGYAVMFAYDGAGNKTAVTDSTGAHLWSGSYTYGLKAFLNTETDMYRGTWQYTPDALGERINWTDPKGQNFQVYYDALSRPTSRTEPDLFTQWTWGSIAGSGNVGKLTAVCTATSVTAGVAPTACTSNPQSIPGYAETKTYDGLARLATRGIQIPGDTTYTYTAGYDPNTGTLSTLTYPTNPAGPALKLQYAYNYGILQSVTDITDSPNIALWTANAEQPSGQITDETFGNQVVVNHAFDDANLTLTSITAGTISNSTSLQNESFQFDAVGNLTQRADNRALQTENVYVDAANRLDHTTINGNPDMQMSYNPNGSIATRQFAAGPSNTDDYTSPNSMIEDSSNAGAGGAVSWTSFNQPGTIGGASGTSSTFFYGPDHQRWQQQAHYSGAAETTTYIGEGLEKIITPSGTVYRHFVPVGNGTVLYQPGSPRPTILYVTGDHLASSATITDANGNLVLAESFTPWGTRRDPTDWTLPQSATDATVLATTLRQGFTGHEHLDNLDLIDMNGRMYQGAGFMSPDPYVADPTNPQNYNRYSYVENNPLAFVDPTGFCQFPGTGFSTYDPGYPDQNGNILGSGYSISCPPWVIPDIAGPTLPQLQFLDPQLASGGASIPPIILPPPQTLDDCMAEATGVTPAGDNALQQNLGNAAQAVSFFDATTESLLGASSLAVGKTFGNGPLPGTVTSPTNAGYQAFGAQAQRTLSTLSPYLKIAGYGLAGGTVAAAAYNGYQSGGTSGAISSAGYAAFDAAAEYAMASTGVPGFAAAVIYDRAGGSQTIMKGAAMTSLIKLCNAKYAPLFIPAD